ncbi:DinB family protein [Micromonospora sp. NBC_01813]|uniref:DinB family protein n=1 Tax=Micromonospora sp. NBC_01813 TaxID=2975988 RepID=UPI002DDA246A|nr:DinB family protein [Micromonospora sp. NBC_01813]WSA09573.1 DinB family protein [Micromonospora sp. NBC_01813]
MSITVTGERADLLATLRKHRDFLRFTAAGLDDSAATTRSTVSELTIGGIVKHLAVTEQSWMRFAVGGAAEMERVQVDWLDQHRMRPDETLSGLLDEYAAVAEHTDGLISSLPDLDIAHPLPQAPWYEPGASWSVRRVVLHLIAETAQHAGHADIIRESIDGQKTMG